MAESLCHWCWGTEATHGWVDGCSCCTTAPQYAEHLCHGVLLFCSGSPRRQQGHPAAHLGHGQLLLSEGAEITYFYGEKRVLVVTTGTESKGCASHFRKNTWVLFSGDLSFCTCPPTHIAHKTCPRAAWRVRLFSDRGEVVPDVDMGQHGLFAAILVFQPILLSHPATWLRSMLVLSFSLLITCHSWLENY